MAVVNFTGFETGTTSLVDCPVTSGTVSVQSTINHISGFALRCNPATSGVGSVLVFAADGTGINAPTLFTRFYFYIAMAPAANDEEFLSFLLADNTTYKLSFRLTSTGKIAAYNSTASLMATGTTVLSTGTWYLIEAKCGTGASAAYEIKINGASELSGTGSLNTTNNGGIGLGKNVNRNSQSVDFYFDDCLMDNAAYPGAGRCVSLPTSANGAYQTFTAGAGAGSHWQIVNEIPADGNTSYLVSTGVSGNAETEAVKTGAAAGITVQSVNAVRGFNTVARDGASNGTLQVRVRSNTTDSDGTVGTTRASYGSIQHFLLTDPATSAAWLPASLDHLQVGSVEGSATKSRLSNALIMVDFVPAAAIVSPGCFIPLLGMG